MTNEQQQVKQWMTAFGQSCPEKPTIPSLEVRKLRAKLILEEALETIEALGLSPIFIDTHDGQQFDCHGCKIEFETMGVTNLIGIADGCEDLKVVTEGTLVACGLVKKEKMIPQEEYGDGTVSEALKQEQTYDPLFSEVMRSNRSKMWTTDEINYHQTEPRPLNYEHLGELVFTKFTYKGEELSAYRKDGEKWLVKDPSGKVIKSPSYSPANLQPIIDEMSK